MNIKYRFKVEAFGKAVADGFVAGLLAEDDNIRRAAASVVQGDLDEMRGKEVKIYEYLQQIAAGLPADI